MTQPTRGGAVTSVWQTTVQIVSTPPASQQWGHDLPYWASRPCGPADAAP